MAEVKDQTRQLTERVDGGDIAEEGIAANRGDEGVLEGAIIGDVSPESSSDSEEEEEGVVIHAGRASSARRTSFKPSGPRSYVRPQSMESSLVSTEKEAEARATEEELKLLRFNHHKTAFDVDIGALDSHPWRHQHVNVLDYFNYGFTEATWLRYCEKQLKIRAKAGCGPYQASAIVNAENAPSANNQVPPMIQPSYGVPQTAQQYDAINPPTQRQSTIAPPPLPPTALNNAHHQFQTGAPVDLLQQQWFQSQQIHADRFGGSPPPMAGSLETSHSNFAAQSNFNNISSNHSSVFEAVTNRNDYYQESRQSHSRERRRTTRDDSRSRPTDYKRNFDKIADSEENERSRTNADGDRENKRSRRNRSSSREANRKQESSSSRREQRESSKSRYRDNSRERKYRKDRDDFSDRRRRERY